jgi:hypothetical protein
MAIDQKQIADWKALAAVTAELAAKLEARRLNHADEGLVEAASVVIVAAHAFSTEVVPALFAEREELLAELVRARNDASLARAGLAAARGQELLAFLAEYDEARGRAERAEAEVKRLRDDLAPAATPGRGC